VIPSQAEKNITSVYIQTYSTRMKLHFAFLNFLIVVALAQEYADYANEYAQDTLYQDYAQKQQQKVEGGGGGIGLGKLIIGSTVSYLLGGKVHSGRASKKMKKKHAKEQKDLYTQYYNDVYKLQEQNIELQYKVATLKETLRQVQEEVELDRLQRDYDEFKQPDVDGDDQISRAEFNMYVNTYLKNYPGLKESEYPRFEDFDHDGDGYVSFKEYEKQMAIQVAKTEKDAKNAQIAGKTNKSNNAKAKIEGLKDLLYETKKVDSFQDLYSNYKLQY